MKYTKKNVLEKLGTDIQKLIDKAKEESGIEHLAIGAAIVGEDDECMILHHIKEGKPSEDKYAELKNTLNYNIKMAESLTSLRNRIMPEEIYKMFNNLK